MPEEPKPQTIQLPVTPKTVRPTKKQRQMLEFLDGFITEHGYSPSYREIMTALNYTSVATVALHINNLIRRGHIQKRDHSARSLEVVVPLIEQPKKIKSNLVSQAEEKWLLEKVDYYFSQMEHEAIATADIVTDLQVLIRALELLGFDAGAQQFRQRLADVPKTTDTHQETAQA